MPEQNTSAGSSVGRTPGASAPNTQEVAGSIPAPRSETEFKTTVNKHNHSGWRAECSCGYAGRYHGTSFGWYGKTGLAKARADQRAHIRHRKQQ